MVINGQVEISECIAWSPWSSSLGLKRIVIYLLVTKTFIFSISMDDEVNEGFGMKIVSRPIHYNPRKGPEVAMALFCQKRPLEHNTILSWEYLGRKCPPKK